MYNSIAVNNFIITYISYMECRRKNKVQIRKFIKSAKFILIGMVVLLMMAGGCSSDSNKSSNGNPKVQVEMENGDKFVIELYPEYAPKTVDNFVKLVKEGFYDGIIFHRIVDGFMAQGGDPDGTGTGGSSETIEGEFSSNGLTKNTLTHTKGVISMARSGDPNSASSQFFIVFDDATFLDGDYAAFGKVIEGMEVVENFQTVERTMNSMGEMAVPITPVVMKKVSVISE